jgi:hypothetical protein
MPRRAWGQRRQVQFVFPDVFGVVHEVFGRQLHGRVGPVAGGVDEDLGAAQPVGVGACRKRRVEPSLPFLLPERSFGTAIERSGARPWSTRGHSSVQRLHDAVGVVRGNTGFHTPAEIHHQ